ncbi:2-nitropropane dioxygenase [Alkalihalobacillus alcalophilus ATCC 27647 = CGMCC 1.3604]|uniref:Probable nitronate monooxygenase n=1 Tax=Alkalihalobacillus alcalophilus ATCC 27647 = CGMCC 1.3604 TaxID=1218173 RepID=A0A094WEK9_ALKAL|nr:nitronate monooxygenase [Alkalihalobacillus alcalophilus]KGA96194.1 2-nitropropane dioxygenase [Alkalihalobacillus alcalophilus ATCC 27647 = CGMCC 1.3604]MED1563016.1 nitronate monooxygenase [Alkalihalobacillus alcalophilus]THG89451.1 2-nitropropane dioxygenase [Alkalihalobacillus alcalophilus ATCC 27647 = CGMCC 1.3604]
MQHSKLDLLLDNTRLPVICAPMFLVSGTELVIEACKSGIIGSFPLLNARTGEILEEWMTQIKEELAEAKTLHPDKEIAPWAVNLIVHKSNKRYESDLELIRKYEPPIVITSLGKPTSVVEIVHGYGGLVFSDVATLTHAKKAAETGVDGLILVSNGAGGHGGTLNPLAFIASVKQFWNGITLLAGSVTNGRDILATQALGADFAYMGTRFIAASESLANDIYQNTLIESTAEDIVYTDAFSGVNANYLIKSIVNAGLDPEKLKKKDIVDVSHSDSKAWKDIVSAGHGVGTIDKVQTVNEIVNELEEEYKEGLVKLNSGKILQR